MQNKRLLTQNVSCSFSCFYFLPFCSHLSLQLLLLIFVCFSSFYLLLLFSSLLLLLLFAYSLLGFIFSYLFLLLSLSFCSSFAFVCFSSPALLFLSSFVFSLPCQRFESSDSRRNRRQQMPQRITFRAVTNHNKNFTSYEEEQETQI